MKQNWTGQKILIIGAARQGLSLARFLAARGARVTLNDQHTPEQMDSVVQSFQAQPGGAGVTWVLGSHPLELLDDTQLVCVSGGVPLSLPIIAEARRRGLLVTNDSQIFMDEVQAPVIGITGSAGKTTTTTLLGRMAEACTSCSTRKTWVGGNIGLPLVEYVEEIQPDDLVIVEFSSFQLELMTTSPHIGAVLNITPNHLDRHGTLEAYTAAKARILQYQKEQDTAVLNREDSGAWSLSGLVRGEMLSFGRQRPAACSGTFINEDRLYFTNGSQDIELMPRSLVKLRGEHQLLSVLAAAAVASAAGFPVEAIQAGVRDFYGVAHRLEYIGTRRGAAWYNDSIATAPERVIAGIQAFDEPLVLLLGGRDKDLPWEKLADLLHRRVDHVVVFGEAAGKILQAIGPVQPGDRLKTISHQEKLKEAVQAAAKVAEPGNVVLLSPGGTSYDEFKDFEERGEWFRKWVQALS